MTLSVKKYKYKEKEYFMNQKERMLQGLPYKAWLDGLYEERLANKMKIYEFNHCMPNEVEKQQALIYDILGRAGNAVHIEAPFHCDYGYNIEVGDNFFANYNCTILDVGNPCKVIRQITEEDRPYYYKNLMFDVTDYK